MQYLSSRDIYKSFSLMSSVTLLTIILGVITTKIAAIFGGLEIIGKLELYRKLIGLIVPILAAGSSAIIVQRISNSSSEKNISNVLSGTSSLFLIQTTAILFLAIMFADEIAVWLFSAEYKTLNSTVEIRIVILMSIAVLSLQTLTAIINGKVELKRGKYSSCCYSVNNYARLLPITNVRRFRCCTIGRLWKCSRFIYCLFLRHKNL